MKYGQKVKVTSGFYKGQAGTIRRKNDGFIGILAGTRIYTTKSYTILLSDGFETDAIYETDLKLIK